MIVRAWSKDSGRKGAVSCDRDGSLDVCRLDFRQSRLLLPQAISRPSLLNISTDFRSEIEDEGELEVVVSAACLRRSAYQYLYNE